MVEYTVEEIERDLIDHYGEIPKRDVNAYVMISDQINLNSNPDISYEERLTTHKNLCGVLDIPRRIGLVCRDVKEN